jgi:glycosyltransferase involved in cell wall biosynthesis
VSIAIAAVVPLHNKAAFIERALRSALAQTSPLDEIIVVDDASTDAGPALVRELAAQSHAVRIELLRRSIPGPGGYAARNLAIEAAQANWIAFLDADDAWRPDFVATLRALIADAPDDVGAVFTARRFVREDGSAFVQAALPDGSTQAAEMDFDGFLRLWRRLGRCPMWTSATAIRRDVLIGAGLFPAGRCKRGGDKETWLRVMAVTKAIASPVIGATYYNDVAEQVTRSVSVNQRHCLCDTLMPMIETSSGERRRLLKWIFNSEIQKYARWMFGKQRLAPEVYRGFYTRENPALYLSLRAMSVTPLPLQRALRNVAKKRMTRTRLSAPAAQAPAD